MDFEVLKKYDDLPDVYYLTDLETLEVVWINKIGKRLFNTLKPNQKCYEYFYKLTNPCRHCKRCEFIEHFEEYSNGIKEYNRNRTFNGLSYKQKKRTIGINNRKYLLHRIYEVNDIVNNFKTNSLSKELFEALIAEITNIDVTANIRYQIERILSATKNMFRADKVSLTKSNDETNFPTITIKNDEIKNFHYNPIMKEIISKDDELKGLLEEDSYLIIYADEIGKTYPEVKKAMLDEGDLNFIMMKWCIDDLVYYLVIENSKIILEDKKIFKLIYNYFFFTLKSFLYNDSLYHLSNIDNLTGLFNRNKYNYDLANSYQNTEQDIAVLYLDLDNLKDVNDNFGHTIGDKLLTAASKILRECFSNCNVYRIGGDEFIVIGANTSYEEFLDKVKRMDERMQNGKIFRSYGISYHKDNAIISEMVVEAEHEMYVYKRRHHDKYSIATERNAVIEKIEKSIQENHFYLVLQPKINPYTNEVVGAEALVRGKMDSAWQYPNEFIPLFEKNNCVDLIDYFMLEEAVKLQRYILDTYKKSYPISVNVARSTLLLDTFEQDTMNLLKKYNVPLEYIRLEVTERMNVSSEDILNHGQKLRNYGLHLEVDDFGSHFTNLGFLSKDVFSVVKIDKTIFNSIKEDNITAKLIEVVIDECHKKNVTVLAEGVETLEDLELIKKMYIDEVQGFYYDKPMNVDEFIAKYIK